MEVIAHDEAAITLFQAIRSGGFGNEPVAGRIVIAKLERGWLGIESNQAAVAAFDNLKDLVGGVIETIGGGEEHALVDGAAGGARVGFGGGGWRSF